MTRPEISAIAPLFIVNDVPTALAFYRDQLGFEVTFQGPEPEDIFFGIVERGAAMIMFKAVGVDPVPNYTRDVQKGIARWDAYLHVPDPDALAAEFSSRDVELSSFPSRSKIPMTACWDSRSRMPTATFCFSVVRVHEPVRRRRNRLRRGARATGYTSP